MTKDEHTPFDYLLNRMEHAGKAETPYEAGYADARRAVLDYVRGRDEALRVAEKALGWTVEADDPADEFVRRACRAALAAIRKTRGTP